MTNPTGREEYDAFPAGDHTPFDYRPEGQSRVIGPADVCDTCSDFTSDPIKLVPASFCSRARAKLSQMYPWSYRDEHGGMPTDA